jgi:rRNA maturation endonuclease Nob1
MRNFKLRCLRCFSRWSMFTDVPEPLMDKTCPFCGNVGSAVRVTEIESEEAKP